MNTLQQELDTLLAAIAAQKKFSRDDWEALLLAKLVEEDGHEQQQSH